MEQPEGATGGQQGCFVEWSGYRENAGGDERSEWSWAAAVAREDPHRSDETTRPRNHRLFADAAGAGLEAFTWAVQDSNLRPPRCKAGAIPLWALPTSQDRMEARLGITSRHRATNEVDPQVDQPLPGYRSR